MEEDLDFEFDYILAVLSEFSAQQLANIRNTMKEKCSFGIPFKYFTIADKYIKCNFNQRSVEVGCKKSVFHI